MRSGLNLLVEEPFYEFDTILEEENKNSPANLFITGPFLMAEKKNKNGRIYPLEEMAKEVARYTKDMIATKRSIGELNHPASIEINPERACHMITEFKQNGNMFFGKSKILNTPIGLLTKSLIQDGVKLGVSSRALGKLEENGDHKDVSDFRLITCDVVHDPSVETAFVDGIYEAKQYVLKCDGAICELVEDTYKNFKKDLSCLPKHNKEQHIKESMLNFINSLKNCSGNSK